MAKSAFKILCAGRDAAKGMTEETPAQSLPQTSYSFLGEKSAKGNTKS